MLVAHLIVAAVFLLDRGGFLADLNDFFLDVRTAYTEHAASGNVVFVAIDARSIQANGQWPWSRQVHADILENLTDAGALDVFFDLDFGFPSDEAGDRAFADALERFGSAYLPVFQQTGEAGASDMLVNRPLPLFADRSWPTMVNVFSDGRGVIRFYPYGEVIDGDYVPSAAALLTGAYEERSGSFRVNFGFQPQSIPILSAVDVANNRFDAGTVAGRSVIVGASAIELGDLFAVPVHGIIPGALIHALAAETLAAGAMPRTLKSAWVCLGLLALLLAFQLSLFQKPLVLILTALATIVASEAAAFGALSAHFVIVPTAGIFPGLLAFCCWSLLRRLAISRWIIRRQSQEVENTSALLRQVFTDSFDAIVIIDETGNVRMRSESADDMFGLDEGGRLLLPPSLMSQALASMKASGGFSLRTMDVMSGRGLLHLEYTVTPSSTVYFEGAVERTASIATLSIRDMTKIREQEREIAYLSNYDALTGAMRRRLLLDFLGLRAGAGEPFAVVAFNLSRFKTINVVLGRDVGDEVLAKVVARLEAADLNISAIARLGGDTFACFTEFATDDAEARAFVQRLCDVVSAPYELDEAHARIGVRIGYTIVDPVPGFKATEALSRAEEALDAAKLAGDGRQMCYDPAVSRLQFRSRQIERAMSKALEHEEFEVWYQPQHRVEDLELIGSEALVRWTSESLGRIYPDEFIAIAESTGFINEIGSWILEKAVRDTMSLPGDLSVAVNVSGVQLTGDDLVHRVNSLLADTGFPAARLCLELTETVFFGGTADLIEKMRDIQFRGVTWALDDFGTGYSSLSYLSKLPFDKIKVDKSFLQDIESDPAVRGILVAISDLGRSLGKTVLCEGVETEEHLAFLRQQKLAEAQGYRFAKAMPFDAFHAYATAQTQQIKTVQAKPA